MSKSISRRDFIKGAGAGLLGGIALFSLPEVLRKVTRVQAKTVDARHAGLALAPPAAADLAGRQWAFVCNTEKCIGCGKCVVACKRENSVPWEPEYNRTWIERYVISESGEIFVDSPNAGRDGFAAQPANKKYENIAIWKSFFVPKLCNQCAKPPCVAVCPVGATYKTADGITLVDQSHCIGCRYCIQACPYGARFVLPGFARTHFGEVRVVDKCTWCYHRIHRGHLPACVEVCPVGARTFGDLRDTGSEVNRLLREKRVYVLKPALGTEPNVSYIGIEKGVE